MRPSVPDVHITDAQDTEFAEYRIVSSQAVLGLIVGLLSPLAVLDPSLWCVPILGVILSVWALRRIKKNAPVVVGRKMAWTGLALSLFFITSVPAYSLVYRTIVRNEAEQFSDLWFQYLVQNQPQKAHQLTLAPGLRQPLNDRLWDYYRNSPRPRKELETYVGNPTVRTLLELGPRARARFYQTAGQLRDDGSDQVVLLYAVTYEESGEKKSFFVTLSASRTTLADGTAGWHILGASGGGPSKNL